MTCAIECRNLGKHYPSGVRAIDDVTLAIPGGSYTLLTGPSGSGKTTLLSLLATLDRPTRGQLLFGQQSIARFSDSGLARLRRQMGFIAQDFALIPGLTVLENITYALIPRGIRRADRLRIAQAQLARVGLEARGRAMPLQLSGGEQQRVAVARALAGNPAVLFADEPTSNLDEESGSQILTLLAEAHSSGTTVVVASHDPRFAARATHFLELSGGRLASVVN